MSYLLIVWVIFVVAVRSAEVVRADDDTTPTRIVTAPSGKFYIVRYTEIFEPGPHERQRLATVPAKIRTRAFRCSAITQSRIPRWTSRSFRRMRSGSTLATACATRVFTTAL